MILQARVGSTRLPRKVLAEVCGRPLLRHVIDRARSIPGVDEVVLATTNLPGDDELLQRAAAWGVPAYAGSSDDVLDRYYQAGRRFPAETIIRVTADCPLLDPAVSGKVLARFREGDVEYACNTQPPTFPDGLDTEVFAFETLARAWREASLKSEREHVTPYIWKNPDKFRIANVRNDVDRSEHRWTVDEPQDLAFIRAVCERFQALGPVFSMSDVLEQLEREPALQQLNAKFMRDEGYAKSLREDQTAS